MPTRWGDFQLLRQVGKGGMGTVYEAVQESLDRRVAVKVLAHPATLDDQAVQRFERESRAAASLHHTNIVPVFGVGEENGWHYYVMQFIDGFELGEILHEIRLLNDATSSRIRSRNASGTGVGDSANVATDPNVTQTNTRSLYAQSLAESLLNGRFSDACLDSSTIDGAPAGTTAGTSRIASASSDAVAEMPTVVRKRPIRPSDLPSESVSTKVFEPQESDADLTDGPSPDRPGESPNKLNRRYWSSVAHIGVQVANALEYAHGYGVLHRDIKPSNLLMDASGTVWVTDFGLAKALGAADLTETGAILGTVRYMAPERFSGDGDIRSDIYSLGLTLYELATQRPAFREQDRRRLFRQILDVEPAHPRQLRPDIPRDLETIVLKAIAREPAHRYQTPRDLADDLRCFLLGKSIAARQANCVERVQRWCGRNPVVASLSAALFVSFLSVMWLWRDAEYERRFSETAETQAREDRDTAVDALQEAQQQRAAAIAASKEARRAVESAIQAETDAKRSEANAKKKLEQLQETLADFERVRQLDEKRHTNLPTLADYQAVLASNFHNLAGLQFATGMTKAAIKSYQQAIVELCLLVAEHPQAINYREALASSYHSLAKVHQETGNPDEAMGYYKEAILVRQHLLEQDSTSSAYRSALSSSLYRLGDLQQAQGNVDEAQQNLLNAFRHREELVKKNPKETRFRRLVAITCMKIGELNATIDKPNDAINFYAAAVENWEIVVEAGAPNNVRHRLAYASACRRLGDAARVAKGADVATPWYSKGIQILNGVLASQPRHADATELITTVHESQAIALTELGDHEQAASQLDRALVYVTEANRNRIRMARALALARVGNHKVAASEANSIADTKDLPVELIYMSAKILVVASVAVGNDTSVDNDIQGGLTQQYMVQAIDQLRACSKANFFNDDKRVEQLKADNDFHPLLRQIDIESLLAE